MGGDDAGSLAAELLAERVRLYHASVWPATAGQTFIAAVALALFWAATQALTLLAWSALLAISIAVRFRVRTVLARAARGDARLAPPALLWRARLGVWLSGAVWGACGVLLFAPGNLESQTLLLFVVAGISAGSLTLIAFDLVGAFGFATAALAPLALRLIAAETASGVAMAVMALTFIAFLGLVGWRGQRNVIETVSARLAAARRESQLETNQARLRQLTAEIASQREVLAVALDSMDQGIISVDADDRVRLHNRRFAELMELPAAMFDAAPTLDEIGRYQFEHGHFGPGLERVDPAMHKSFSERLAGVHVPFPPVYHRRSPAGLMLEIKTRHLADGRLVRTLSDVTAYFDAQQRLRESEAQASKLALVAAHTDNAVAILGPDFRVEWINEGYMRLTGYTLDEVVGRRGQEVVRGSGTDAVEAARIDEQLQREHRASGEMLHFAKDGRPYWFAVEIQAVADEAGQVLRYIVIGRDEAERASRAKSEFLSGMSHELRTPLNAILGFAQLLELDREAPLAARQLVHVQQIRRAGAHLLELIGDVLDLARVEAGKQQVSIEPVALEPLVQGCIGLMRPLAREQSIALHAEAAVPPGLCAMADRTRLEQVLLNLLSNAIKYNRAGGSVRVECQADASTIRLAVRDTGPGLTPQQCARLFNAFERLGAEETPVPGAGIGLALSKRLVELMGGTIGVDSSVGQGSTFWVVLGRAAQEPAAAAAGPAATAPAPFDAAPARRVLYIEDNPVNTLLVEAALERLPGVHVSSAPLPELGIEIANADPPDLILLDIQLPGIDGFEVLRRLRAAPATSAVPVVALSANAMPADIERARAAGFDAYLTKPIDLARLAALVQRDWAREPGRRS